MIICHVTIIIIISSCDYYDGVRVKITLLHYAYYTIIIFFFATNAVFAVILLTNTLKEGHEVYKKCEKGNFSCLAWREV